MAGMPSPDGVPNTVNDMDPPVNEFVQLHVATKNLQSTSARRVPGKPGVFILAKLPKKGWNM